MDRRNWLQAICTGLAWLIGVKPTAEAGLKCGYSGPRSTGGHLEFDGTDDYILPKSASWEGNGSEWEVIAHPVSRDAGDVQWGVVAAWTDLEMTNRAKRDGDPVAAVLSSDGELWISEDATRRPTMQNGSLHFDGVDDELYRWPKRLLEGKITQVRIHEGLATQAQIVEWYKQANRE